MAFRLGKPPVNDDPDERYRMPWPDEYFTLPFTAPLQRKNLFSPQRNPNGTFAGLQVNSMDIDHLVLLFILCAMLFVAFVILVHRLI